MAHPGDQERRDAADSNDNPRPVRRSVPPWKKKLIGSALGIVVLGGAAQVMSMVRDRTEASTSPPPASVSAPSGSNAPAGSRGFVSSSSQQPGSNSQSAAASNASTSRERALWERVAPYVTKFGLSFLAGLVVGIFFRMFLKTMAFITVLAAIGLFCLSYFHVLNFDSNQVRQNYEGIAGWVKEHALALKDAALHALPSGTLGAVGFFAGAKKH
jgi:uncharacterized membrane protein (Fun14 family)